jgi:microcystin degradation protein MlrC
MSARTRVAIVGLYHETNTFSAETVGVAELLVSRGDELARRFDRARATITGFLRGCEAADVEVVPIVHAEHGPSGPLTAAAIELVLAEVGDGLRAAGPLDAVLVAAHGAAAGPAGEDLDGMLLEVVRDAVGGIPVGVALDLHGNLTERMVRAATLASAYRTNPHEDALERGAEVAALTIAAARGEVRPTQAAVKLATVVNILAGGTADEPLAAVYDKLAGLSTARPGVLTASVMQGFAYADVEEIGAAVHVVTDGDPELARAVADELADALWSVRTADTAAALGPAEAVAAARASGRKGEPAVLLDVGDNIGGGAPGDSTVLLAEALAQGTTDFFCPIVDPAAYAVAVGAGLGAEVELTVGAATPDSVGEPVRLRGRVAALHDGRFQDGTSTHGGFRHFDSGGSVLVTTDRDQSLLITRLRIQSTSLALPRSVGIEPGEQAVIVAKGVVAPRAAYRSLTSNFILADTPGITRADATQLRYHRRPQPLFPFDKNASRSDASTWRSSF